VCEERRKKSASGVLRWLLKFMTLCKCLDITFAQLHISQGTVISIVSTAF
jgi:hypothetical protein